jgi:ABC-type glycerol-3-phosphate transport system substrate-binding protein
MILRRLVLSGVGFIVALSLIACDRSKKSESATQTQPRSLQIMSMQQVENPEGPLEREIAEEFLKAHPGVTIEWIGVGANDFATKLQAMATGGTLPDIATVPNETLSVFHELDILLDLYNILPSDFLSNFNQSVLADETYDGKLLLLPYQGQNAALLYRTDWLEETGMNPPATWDEFRTVAKAMTKDTDRDGQLDRWGFAMIGTRDSSGESRFLYFLRTHGAKELYQDATGKWKTDIGNDNFKKALKFFTDLYLVDHVAAPGVLETSYSQAASLLVNERAGLLITGSNAIGTILTQNPNLTGKLASCLIPKETEYYSEARELGYAITKNCKNIDLAREYILHIAKDENVLKWNTRTGRVPLTASASKSSQLDTPEMAGFVAAAQYFAPRPHHPGFTEMRDIVGEAYQSVLAGNATIDQAATKAKARAEDVIASYE